MSEALIQPHLQHTLQCFPGPSLCRLAWNLCFLGITIQHYTAQLPFDPYIIYLGLEFFIPGF